MVIVCLLLNVFFNFEGHTLIIIYIIGFICGGIVLYDDYKKGYLNSIIRKFKRK